MAGRVIVYSEEFMLLLHKMLHSATWNKYVRRKFCVCIVYSCKLEMATYNAAGSALPPSKKKIALQIFTNTALARGVAA